MESLRDGAVADLSCAHCRFAGSPGGRYRRDMRTAIVVLGNGGRRRGSPSITPACLELVREAERIAASQAVDVVVLTGGSPRRTLRGRADARGLAADRPSSSSWSRPRGSPPRTRRARSRFCSSAASNAPSSSARRSTSTARGSSSRGCSSRTGSRPPSTSRPSSRALARSRGRSQLPRSAVGSFERRRRSSSSAGTHERHARLHPRVERGAEPGRRSERSRARVAERGRPRRRRRLDRSHRGRVARARRGGPVARTEPRVAGRDRSGLPLGVRARLRVLRSGRRRRPASGGGALASARAGPRGPLRRRRRFALRLGGRVRALPLPP